LRPLARGLHFLEPEELTAYAFITLLRNNILYPINLRMGTFRGGMTEVMIKPIARYITRRGGILRTSSPLKAIHADNHRVSSFELENGERLTGDVFVSALPLEVFKTKIPQNWQNRTYFQNINRIETVPATAVQLWFDKRFVQREEFVLLAGTPMIVFQDESHITFPSKGSRISCQITDRATDDYSDQQYIDLAMQEVERYLPSSWQANLIKAVVVRHQAFAIKPGTQALRPSQATPIPNFALAGDYTDQDWFTTMEGATRSGEKAAQSLIRRKRPTNRVAIPTVRAVEQVARIASQRR
jgi:15-cis-phytoene desaturase